MKLRTRILIMAGIGHTFRDGWRLLLCGLAMTAHLAGAAVGATAAAPAKLRLVTENFAPYTVAQGRGVSGPAADTVRALMSRAQVPYSLEVMPWAQAYATAANDAGTCVFSTVRTPERERNFEWVGPIVDDYHMGVFARTDDPRQPRSLEELRGAVLGSFAKSATAEFFRDQGFGMALSTSDEMNPRKLLQKRFDYWVAGAVHGQAVLAQQGLVQKVQLLFEFERAPMWLACNLNLPRERLEQLQAAWQVLLAERRRAAVAAARPDTLTVCASVQPAARVSASAPVSAPAGAAAVAPPRYAGWSLEVFEQVFDRLKLAHRFVTDLPWSRCLKMAEVGSIDFALGAYADPQRAKVFTYSQGYVSLTPQVFFRADNPLDIQSTADLRRYKGCGILGQSYAHYGLQPGNLDLGVTNFDGIFAKLKAGRCDYVLDELEVVAGLKRTGRDFLADPAIRHAPVPGAIAPTKHMIAAKGDRAARLLPAIDAELTRMVASGEAAAIWRRYEATPYRP